MAASLASVYSLYERIIIFNLPGIKYAGRYREGNGCRVYRKELSDRVILLINRVSGILYLLFGIAILIGIIYTLVKD
jgi:hypothetical protein